MSFKFVAFLMAFVLPVLGLADSYYVEKFGSVSTSQEDADSVRELIASSLSSMGESVSPTAKDSAIVVGGKVVKLGASYVITVSKRKGGKVVFGTQMKAARAEELDVVANRLARALVDEQQVAVAQRVDDVTESEASKGTTRTATVNRWSVGFGPYSLRSMGLDETAFGLYLGYNWEVKPQVALNLSYESASGEKESKTSHMGIFALGANYFFNTSDISPFVGAKFGYGSAQNWSLNTFELASSSGFGGGLSAGAHFFRTSRVNLELALSWQFLFTDLKGQRPSTTGIRIGLLF